MGSSLLITVRYTVILTPYYRWQQTRNRSMNLLSGCFSYSAGMPAIAGIDAMAGNAIAAIAISIL